MGQVVGVLVGGVGAAAVGFDKHRRKLPTVLQPGLLRARVIYGDPARNGHRG